MLTFTPDELDGINELVREAFRENLGEKNYTGALSDSVEVVWIENEQRFDISFLQYGMNFNNPQKGVWPPVDKIRKWVVDRGLISASEKKYKIDSVAYLVGRKIHDKGVEPFDTLKPIFDKLVEIGDFITTNMAEKMTEQVSARIMDSIDIARIS